MKEIFIPRQRIPIHTQQEVDEYRMLYSGKKNLYESVYAYDGEISPRTAIVDKIFLDFDYDEDLKFFTDIKKVSKYLLNQSINFTIRFSGKGFHLFIFLDTNIKLKNPKQAIRKWTMDMHKKTDTDSDHSVIGDLRRVSRMVGTVNLKTHLYCIPISYSDLHNLSYEEICQQAKNIDRYQGSVIDDLYVTGDLLDISDFDNDEEPKDINYNINIDNIEIKQGYPPCIKQMLKNPELGYYERGQLILYLRDDGYSLDEILIILKKILSEAKYYHCVEEEQQPMYLYCAREDLLFSSCQTLKDNGICSSNECSGQWLYL